MATLNQFKFVLPTKDDSPAKVLSVAKSGKTGLTANAAIFPNTPISMVDYGAKITALENSMVEKKYSSDATREVRDKHKEDLVDMIVEQAAYAFGVANGSRYTAGLSGFPLSKETSETIPQGPFTIKSILPGGLPGTAVITIGTRGGNDMFKVYLKVGEDYVMLDAFMGKTYTLTGLPSGTSNIRIIGFKGDHGDPVVNTVANAF